jgi:hypothetical protein
MIEITELLLMQFLSGYLSLIFLLDSVRAPERGFGPCKKVIFSGPLAMRTGQKYFLYTEKTVAK